MALESPNIFQGRQQILGVCSVWIAGNTHSALGLCFASKISWIHGMAKVGKALQDHGVQPLTQHCSVPKYHIKESSKSTMFHTGGFKHPLFYHQDLPCPPWSATKATGVPLLALGVGKAENLQDAGSKHRHRQGGFTALGFQTCCKAVVSDQCLCLPALHC